MHANLPRIFKEYLRHEGGFVNNPQDPGGATNKGITLTNYRKFVNPKATVADLKKITDDEVFTVFVKYYWNNVMGDQLPSGVDLSVVDYAVNSGPNRAEPLLQRLVGATVDGTIGPETLAKTEEADPTSLVEAYNDERLAFLKVAKNRKTGELLWPVFGKGWTARVKRVRQVSLELIGNAQSEPASVNKPVDGKNWWPIIIAFIATAVVAAVVGAFTIPF